MGFSSWIAARFGRVPRSARPARLPSRRYRPTLELLENRLAPAALTVNTLSDSTGGSQLSLRDAILAVNGGSYSGPATGQVSGTFGSNDTILFLPGLNGTLSLTTAKGPLLISSNLAITANPTLNPITLSGQFAGSQTGVFNVTSAATATIAGLTITQGKDSTNLFGAIYVQAGGALTVNGCTFVNNQSAGPGGGAILNGGTLTVTNSTFANNSGVAGGAIDNLSGATATLINCTISGNQATTGSGTGGGVANAGTLQLLNTLVAQNMSAGSDPDVVGAFTSFGHNLVGNATGSTGLTDGVNGDQVGSAAPFTGDVTSGLAIIDTVSSTAGLVVGQLVTDTAGAFPAGTVIAVLGTHSLTLSQAATKSQTGVGFTSSVYANLGPLQTNGGGIKTMALLPTSSAIDAGANSDAVLTVAAADQRGVSRPQAGTVDIGAFEANQLLVTNLNDSGAGSLRDALTQSNSIPGTVLIDFQAGLTGTISLTTARLEVVHDDWIRGPGAAQITVDGNLNYWCFGVDSQYTVGSPGLHVAIYGLTMTRGQQVVGINDSRGGAISYRNTHPFDCILTVADCVIQNSVNGGIYAEDRLSVINCQIINNTGHGISGGQPYVSNSWIAGNSSQGLNGSDHLVLTSSTFSGNGTGTSGDGVYMGDDSATVTNCTFTENRGRGFVINYQDTALLTNCTLVSNVGSDLLSIGGNAIPRNSIVDRLDTQNGFGTITSGGNNFFRSTTPSGMTVLASDVSSPGISSSSTAFNGNLQSGTYYYVIGAVTATGTLTSGSWPISVAFNNTKVNLSWTAPVGIAGVTGYKVFRGTAMGGEKLIGTVSAGTTSFIDTGGTGSSSVPMLLGALADNGGPAPTIAPTTAGSVYTSNKANSAFAPCLDECGHLRNPIFPGIGAFESASSTPNTVSLSPESLVGIDQGLDYSQTITASGGTGSGYLIGITAGSLPPGFTFTYDGGATAALTGTATTLGSFAFSVTCFDSAGNFGSRDYTLIVSPAPSITTSTLSIGTENAAYSQAILTSGGTAPFTWSYTGTLPSGITFDTSTGTFGGTPAAGSAGTYNNIQVTATDCYGESATQTYSMTIHWALGLSPALPADTLNTAYNQSQNITGGSGTYSALNVTGLPSGLTASLSGTMLTISGTPTVSGTFPLSITLHDDGNNTDSNVAVETLTVNPALAITTTSLPSWTETVAYNQSIDTTGGTAPLTFSLSAGTLPVGLNLNSTTGVISGTSSVGSAGSHPFTVDVTDAAGATVRGSFTLTINVPPALGTLAPTQWTVGRAGYTGAIPLSGGTGALTVSAQLNLPPGLSAVVVGSNVVFTGTPTTAGTFANVQLTVRDTRGATSTGTFTITVNAAPTLGALSSSAWTKNLPGFSATATVSAGTGPYGGLTASNLPPGLTASLSGSTITVSGTPTTAGTFANATLSITDAAGAVVNQAYTVVINAVSLGALSFNQWSINKTGFIGTIAASTGTGAFTLSMTSGNLPTGMTNSLSGGLITFAGKPTIAGTYTFALMLTDSLGGTATQSYTIVINPAKSLVWTGLGADANWMTPGNWAGGAAPLAGYTLLFGAGPGTARTTATNNFPIGTAFAALHFLDRGYTLTGNGLKLSAGISSAGTTGGTNTVALDVALAATETFNIGAGQSLALSGIISGAGGLTVNKSGTGTLILTNANTYTGSTTINAGIAVVQNPTALGSTRGATKVASGATLQVKGGLTIADKLTLNGTGAAGTTGALECVTGTNTWAGAISLASASTIAVDAGQLTISGVMSGKGSLTRAGAGSLIVSALNTYTGGTTVNGGVLAGGGKIGALLVNSGATLAPSTPITQIFKTGNVAFSAGSTFAVALRGATAGTGYDQISVTGTVNLAGATLNVNLGFTPALGSAFVLIQNNGTDAVVGAFAGLPEGATLLLFGMTFQISYVGGTGNDVVLTRIA